MVEEDVARFVAQHFMQRRPRRRRIKRCFEQLLDPGGEQVLHAAIPRVAQWPGISCSGLRPRRLIGAYGDFAGNIAAVGRSEVRPPFSGGRRVDLGEPEIRRPAEPLAPFGSDVSSGATRDNSPLSGFSEVKTTRNGAPFHGAAGEARTARLDSSQAPDRPCAWAVAAESTKTESAVAASNAAVAAGVRRGGSKRAPCPELSLGPQGNK